MNSTVRSLLFICVVIVPALAFGQVAKPSLADLAWMSGCWEMSAAEKGLRINEQWMSPSGGMMMGAGRTVKGGKAVDFEFLRIVEEADGIYYVAKPKANKEETRFKLVKLEAGEVIFENPAHDFPQRIIYRREGERLNARIEGSKEGKTRGLDFPYLRTKCE